MKPTKTDGRIEDSLVQLLLPITRLLIHEGIGIDELVHAAKRAYLSEAMQAVARQGSRASISRLSVATGMTRKEVSALLSDSQKHGSAFTKRSGQQRALRVLRGWLTDSRFRDRSGRPAKLSYRGDKKSFTLLVKLYGGDVTPRAVLRDLERIEVVHMTRAGALQLRPPRMRPNFEVHYKLSDLAKVFEDFAFAVLQQYPSPDARSFFGFKDSIVPSPRDAAYFMSKFSRRATAFMQDFQQWAVVRESDKSASHQGNHAMRVGLGVYLLHADPQGAHSGSGSSGTPSGVRRAGRRIT